jgi:hypothetical protein
MDKPLSPAAQAVLDAFLKAPMGQSHVDDDLIAIAAALRAVADQVVPTEMDLPPIAPDLGHFRQHERRLIRQRFLAIAAELEAANE